MILSGENYLELTKKLIGNDSYSKFDWVDRLIAPERLLMEKARILKSELA